MTTTNIGGWWGGWIWQTPGGTNLLNGNLNGIRCGAFFLPFTAKIEKMQANITVASSGGHADVGYYNASTLNLTAHTGAMSTNSTGVQTITLGSPVTLSPGEYYECYTFDNGTAAFSGQ